MRGIDFDRHDVVPSESQMSRPTPPLAGVLIVIVALVAIAILGYKVFVGSTVDGSSAEIRSLEQIQQQLADVQKRIDELEKRHKASSLDAEPVPSRVEANTPRSPTPPARTVYRISAAGTTPEPEPSPRPALNSGSSPQPGVAGTSPDRSTASQEAWRATTDRLANVVGVVGSQQGEILQTREQLNQLLAQTQRTAVQFELRRGTNPQAVGPVSLLLKYTDSKNQRYSVCVFVEEKCIELKNRSLDEVVVFVVSRDTAPLELVATKVGKGQITGYLEVPRLKAAP